MRANAAPRCWTKLSAQQAQDGLHRVTDGEGESDIRDQRRQPRLLLENVRSPFARLDVDGGAPSLLLGGRGQGRTRHETVPEPSITLCATRRQRR